MIKNQYAFNLSLTMKKSLNFDELIDETIQEQYLNKVYKYGLVNDFKVINRGYITIDTRDTESYYVCSVMVEFDELVVVKDYVLLFKVLDIISEKNQELSTTSIKCEFIHPDIKNTNIFGIITYMKTSQIVRSFLSELNKGCYINCKVINDPRRCASLSFIPCSITPSKVKLVKFKGADIKLPDFNANQEYRKMKFVSMLFELGGSKSVNKLDNDKNYSIDPFGIYECKEVDVDFLKVDQLQTFIDNLFKTYVLLIRSNAEHVEKDKASLDLLELYDKF